ncbi:UNVERIFIED_CONTAM: putative L-gulonolactone oxidase 6 [Sesamum calycinum]|uniref:L-gulonolactone oxidase 6 n=1 Tax=Sesamum calycinum TaxID=2727403 RepID=A0AAW2R8L8_9LAMI
MIHVRTVYQGSSCASHQIIKLPRQPRNLVYYTSWYSPPEDPIQCRSAGAVKNSYCTITNSYGAFPDRSICRAAQVVYPSSEAEIIAAVANATMAMRKIKVATRYSHSIPKLVCPDGDDGLLISTKYLNRTLNINPSAMTITVESGVTLRQLINDAAKTKLALPYAPYWWGLTVRIISPATAEEGYAKVRTLETGNPELDAAKVSLGFLELFRRKWKLTRLLNVHGRLHEFADFMWYPSQKLVVYRIDDRVSSNASGNGLNDFPGFRSTPSIVLATLRTAEETQESLGDVDGKCINGKLTSSTLRSILFTGYPVIGYQNRIQASGTCLDSLEDARITACPWDSRIWSPSQCGLDLYNGILMRYVTASSAYLGKQEDALDFDITYYRSKDPLTPRLYEDILEEIEQIAVFKYNALPHWGKNRNVAFQGAINKYKKATEFLRIKQMYDPLGLFSSNWTDQILGLSSTSVVMLNDEDGCALEGLCICSQDIHCAPNKGYFCRPGKVYEEARVCAKLKKSMTS